MTSRANWGSSVKGEVGSVGAVDELRQLLAHDRQAAPSDVPLARSRAGVRGVQKAECISHGGAEKLIAAEIDCTVDLERAQKGVRSGRFPELFEEAIEEVVAGQALLVETLAEQHAPHIVERQSALRRGVRIVGPDAL